LAIREFREVGKFWMLGGLDGRNDPLAGNKCIFTTSCRLSFHSGDYCTERLVTNITVVLHVVKNNVNISIYYSIGHHVRILDKNLSGTRIQLL
jgi:hypothetical protein